MSDESSNNARPLVSVITVVLNGESFLEECIRSVRIQAGVTCEHILIDGGSTDGTLGIARRHADHFSYWSSEPDRGISDAMNKGIARARGEWLLFLQADDYLLAQDSLADCAKLLKRSVAGVVAFPVRFGMDRSRTLKPHLGGPWINLKLGISHQGCFFRREVFDRLGGYDVQLRICMDYDFCLRAWRAGTRFENAAGPPATFMRATGISSRRDWKSLQRRLTEEHAVHLRHARGGLSRFSYDVYWPVYMAYRWSRFQLSSTFLRARNPYRQLGTGAR